MRHTLLLAAILMGCNGPANNAPTEAPAAIDIRADLGGDHDVSGVWLAIDQVDCSTGELVAPYATGVVDPIREAMPDAVTFDGLVEIEGPARHVALDLHAVVEPGCYSVESTPLASAQAPLEASLDCTSTVPLEVHVGPGQTSAVTLLATCAGDPPERVPADAG